MSAPLILLTAGGTGGHVFPAEALAQELGRRGHRLALVTDRRGAAFSGALGQIDGYRISAAAIAGKSPLRRLGSAASLLAGYWQARGLLKRLRPAVVVGFGGYASVPSVLAASHAGIATALHEQNAVLGRANRLLAPRVSKIATSYDVVGKIAPGWRHKLVETGMPVRPAIAAERGAAYPVLEPATPIALLVVGGSQGARIFSDLVPAALLRLPDPLRARLRVSQQCRADDLDAVRTLYQEHGIEADLRSFFDDMPARLASAHLVIARSGASTMAELATLGRPAILVPYPHAIDDHQSANAAAFAARGAGWLMPQSSLTPEILANRLSDLFTAPDLLRRAADQAMTAFPAEAANRLADLVVALAGGAR